MKRRAPPLAFPLMPVVAWLTVGAVLNVAVAWLAATPLNCTSRNWSSVSDVARPALTPREWPAVYSNGRN